MTAVYTFIAAFPALLQLLVYPVIEGENRLGPVDFGYLAITEAIISVIFIICTYGMVAGLSRFYYDYRENREKYNRLVSTVITGIIGRGLVLLGIALIFAPFIGGLFPQADLRNFSEYGPSLVITGLNRAIIITLLALYRNEKRLRLFITVSLLSGILRASFQLSGVFLFDMSFKGYVHGTALGSSFIAIGSAVYTYYNCGFHYNRNIMHSVYPFTRPLFLSDFILWGLLFADRFFLLKNPGDLGIYDNAMKFAIGLQLIIQGLTNALQPEMFRYLKMGVTKKAAEIKTLSNLFMAESTGLIILAIIPVMLFISIFYETELSLSAGLVTIIFVRFILNAQYKIFAIPVMYAKKTNIFLYVNTSVLAINILLNWLLTPAWGYYGAITAFFCAYLIQVLLFYQIQRRYLSIDWNRKKLLYFPLGVVLLAILTEVIKFVLNADPFIVSIAFVTLSGAGLVWLYRREIVYYLSGKEQNSE